MELTQDQIYHLWGTGNIININGIKYKVHRMSYGDYFLEPATYKGSENDGFSTGTQWFTKKVINNKIIYQLN